MKPAAVARAALTALSALTLVGAAGLGVGACASHGALPKANAEVAAAQGVPLETLQAGRAAYAKRCLGCHALIPPGDYTRDEWPRWIDEMAPRAALIGEEREAVLHYVLAYAKP